MERSVKKEKSREQILEAAIKCFSEKGFQGTTIEEIIEEAGMSKGGVYHHFSGKEDIFLEAQDRWRQKALEDIASDLKVGDMNLVQTMERVVDRVHRYMNKDKLFLLAWIEFASVASRDEKVRKNLIKIKDKHQKTLMEQLKELVKRGEIRDIDIQALSTTLSVLHDGLLFNGVVWPERFSKKKTLKQVMGLMTSLIQAN